MPELRNARTRFRIASAALLSFALFFPFYIEQIAPLRLVVVAIGFAAVALEVLFLPISRRARIIAVVLIGAYLCLAVLAVELVAMSLGDRLFAVNAEHLFVMFPLFAALGGLLLRLGQARAYLMVLLGVAAAVSVLAVIESFVDFSLLGRAYEYATSQREGTNRALVGSENVLVLGAILATMVPLTLVLPKLRYQIAVCALLVAGVWATGSRFPALIATAIALVQFFPQLRSLLTRFTWVLHSLAALALAGLAYLSLFVWHPFIAGSTGLDYSANYRGAIYSLVPQFLLDRPLGYLLAAPTGGYWVVDSELHGGVDVSLSVDSEIVYAIFGLGWLGLALYAVAVFTSIAAIKRSVPLGLSSLALTALGFSLALHGWDAMSPFWYTLLGACISVTVWPWVVRKRDQASAATSSKTRPTKEDL